MQFPLQTKKKKKMQFPLKLHIKKILTDALRTLISLKTIFINILWENDKSINFFDFFFLYFQ